jgi:pimeloyl-ACP methyl ester carboxylesterase
VIHGDADKTVPIDATGKQAVQMIPDAKLIVYEGAPHGFFYTERQRLNRDLIAFMREEVFARA